MTPGKATEVRPTSARPVPEAKRAQVRDRLEDLLEGLGVGDALPAERRLAADLGVARMTLRGVVDELVREGRLTRRQGAGTYVAEPKIAWPLALVSFSEDMRRRGYTPASRTLTFERRPAGARIARRLGISPRAEVVRAVRLRLADDEPMALETLHVPAERVPGLSADDLAGSSFYELLAERYAITLAEGVQTIEPTLLEPEEANLMGLAAFSPALLFTRTTRDTADVIVEDSRSLYRGDRYRLDVELRAPRAGTA